MNFSDVFALLTAFYLFVFLIRNNWVALPLIIFASQIELGFGRLINLPLSFSQLIFIISLFAYLLGKLFNREKSKYVFANMDFWVLMFLIWIILGSIALQNLDFSSTGITRQISFVVTFFFAALIFKDHNEIRKATILWVLVSINLLFFQFFEAINLASDIRLYYGRNSLALEMAISGIMAMMLGFDENRKNFKRFFFMLAFLFMIGIIINTSRGVLIAFSVSAFILLIIRGVKVSKIILLGLIGVALFSLNSLIENNLYSNSIGRLLSTNVEEIENETRYVIWRAGMELASQNPWFGVGVNNFQDQISIYGWENNIRSLTGGKSAHNMFVSIAVEFGLPGLFILLVIIATGYKYIFQKIKMAHPDFAIIYPLLAALLVFTIEGFFADIHRMASFWMVFGLLKSVHRLSLSTIPRKEKNASI